MQRLSRHLLEQIVALDEDALVVTDAWNGDHPIVYVNAAFERLTGYLAAEVAGRNCRFLQGSNQDQAALTEVKEALRHDRPCVVEMRNYRKNGEPFTVRLQLEPLRDTRGRVRYYLGRLREAGEQAAARATPGARTSERNEAPGLVTEEQFLETCKRDFGVARREKRPLIVLAFGVEEYDLYLKTFGNQAAESCLRMVGGRISGALRRAGDICARLDNATFAALLLGQEASQATSFAESIAEQVRKMALHHPRSEKRVVTVATGLAGGVPGRKDSPESLVRRALSQLQSAMAPKRRAG